MIINPATTRKNYGWIPDTPDHRDYRYTPIAKDEQFPADIWDKSVLLRDRFTIPKFEEQLDLGSCTGEGGEFLHMFNMLNRHTKTKHRFTYGSVLFLYYNNRIIQGTVDYDSGAQIRDTIKSLATWGICSVKTVPYDISKFTRKPAKKAYTQAVRYKALEYNRIDNTDPRNIIMALREGFPVIHGFAVYESFESSEMERTGIVPMPGINERLLGGHCTVIIGWDAETRMFYEANWWGQFGYFYGPEIGYGFKIPVDYIQNDNLCDDFWILKTEM